MRKNGMRFSLCAWPFALCFSVVLPLALSVPVSAQQTEKVPRIGVLSASGDPYSSLEPQIESFRKGLRELGYVEGKISWSNIATLRENRIGS